MYAVGHKFHNFHKYTNRQKHTHKDFLGQPYNKREGEIGRIDYEI